MNVTNCEKSNGLLLALYQYLHSGEMQPYKVNCPKKGWCHFFRKVCLEVLEFWGDYISLSSFLNSSCLQCIKPVVGGTQES